MMAMAGSTCIDFKRAFKLYNDMLSTCSNWMDLDVFHKMLGVPGVVGERPTNGLRMLANSLAIP